MNYPKILTSSIDSTKLSLMVKSVAVGVIPVILLAAGVMGWDIGQSDLDVVMELTIKAIVTISAAISAVMALWGALRKILVATGFIAAKK